MVRDASAGHYDLDCPCFDVNGSNVVGQGVPGYVAGGVSLGDACVSDDASSGLRASSAAGGVSLVAAAAALLVAAAAPQA